MSDDIEVAVPKWSAIAKSLGCHVVTACRMKKELEEAGVIFYRRNRFNKRIVHHFPSRLRAWTGLKGSKGEII
jgi:DNA-binding transcriptional regulator YhcF (GntR family)